MEEQNKKHSTSFREAKLQGGENEVSDFNFETMPSTQYELRGTDIETDFSRDTT